ncbi:MAG: sigma-70 family RNA polymerase sigma factor [Lentisphaerota bacterium]
MNTPAAMDIDAETIREILKGRIDLYEKLIEKYKARVWRIVSRRVPERDAGDVAMEVFIEAYRSLSSFSGRGPFEHWLSHLAFLVCCNYWRREKRRPETPASSLADGERDWLIAASQAQSTRDFEALNARAEAQEMIHKALSHLEAEDRMILNIVHLEGHSVAEAAEQTGWSRAKVKIRAMRARHKMKCHIEQLLKEVAL